MKLKRLWFGRPTASASESSQYGLHIYMEFLNQSTQLQTEPIKCTSGLDPRYFALERGGVLKFTSKVTDGAFTRVYCLQIIRDSVVTDNTLKLSCRKPSTGTLPSERTSSSPHVDLWTSENAHQIITDKPTESEPKLNIVIGVVACVVAVIVILSAMLGILYTRRNKKKANDSIPTKRDPKYDVLSISRDVSTYSSLTTPQTPEQEYEIVFPRGDTNDI